jgi:hypothetical protein
MFVPNWTETPETPEPLEPVGVNWTTRKPWSNGEVASGRYPRFP